MSQPAARITDMHTCPMLNPPVVPAPPVPHVGGPILPVPPATTVTLIGGLPAATVGNLCTCVGPPDSIVKGSPTVLIGGKPAARMGDSTAHGGVISAGFPKVLIGDSGSGSGGGGGVGSAAAVGAALGKVAVETQRAMLQSAAESGAPFCEECERARLALSQAPPASVRRTALIEAADAGVPFCEECERARIRMAEEAAVPAPDRAALQDASQTGQPLWGEDASLGSGSE
jgi:uncharacterized Zn-binding protein involved in type VI secretion